MITHDRAREIVAAINEEWNYSLAFKLSNLTNLKDRLPLYGDDFLCIVEVHQDSEMTEKSARDAKATIPGTRRYTAGFLVILNTRESLTGIHLRVVAVSKSEHVARFRGAVTMARANNLMGQLEDCSRGARILIQASGEELLTLKLEMEEDRE